MNPPRLGWIKCGPCEAASVLLGPLNERGTPIDEDWEPWQISLGDPTGLSDTNPEDSSQGSGSGQSQNSQVIEH